MKQALAFARRCAKELLRDPLTLIFSLGLPLVLIFVMTAIRRGTGVDIFPIESFGPAAAVFGQTFIAMFTGLLLAQDRSGAYLTRLFASPMGAKDFLLGYSLPIFPMALLQGAVCLGVCVPLGLPFGWGWFRGLICLIPSAALFIALGLLLGSLLRETQVGGVASILIQVAAFSSGMWFQPALVGGGFQIICRILPFLHAVEGVKAGMRSGFGQALPHLGVVCAWAAALYVLGTLSFRRQMKGDAR